MLLQVSLAPASAGSALPGVTSDMLGEVGFMAAPFECQFAKITLQHT